MLRKSAIIFGTASFASVVRYYLENDSEYRVSAYAVHRERISAPTFEEKPVVAWEDLEQRYPPGDHDVFIAVGYAKLNTIREQLCTEARARGYRLLTYVCSKATTWPDLEIGDNCFVFEDNTVQPFVSIGNGTILWSGNHVGHHSTIGRYCFVTSHVVISGHCTIGDRCFLGVNSTITEGVSIAADNLIGPATLIQKDTQPKQAFIAERSKLFPKESTRFFK